MIRLLALLLGLASGLVTALLPVAVMAGAWPREAGTGFASLSQWQGLGGANSYTALFVEYGLTPRLTLGLDAGRSVSGDGKTVAFLRTPVMRILGGPVAAELGYGQIAGRPVLRPGLSWGRSVARPRWQGWLAIDTRLEVDLESRKLDEKTDITLGLTPLSPDGRPADWTMMLQLQTGVVDIRQQLFLLQTEGIRPGASFLRLVPSVTYRLRDGLQLEIGYVHPLDGSGARAIKLGLWSTF
jgi:hypothetical protein